MSELDDLLDRLSTSDVQLSAADGMLRYDAPRAALSTELLDELRRRKAELLARLDGAVRDEAPVTEQQGGALSVLAHLPKLTVFNVPTRIWLTGNLELPALRLALMRLVRRHVALRCRYVRDVEGNWRQHELAAPPLSVPLHDLRGLAQQDSRVEQLCRRLADTPFDLGRWTVPNAEVLRLAEDRWVLMLVTHHFGTDGWALSQVLRELAALYDEAVTGAPHGLAEPAMQCTDFARWQQEHRDEAADARKIEFWRRQLADAALTVELPTDRPRPQQRSGAGETIRIDVPARTRTLVEGFAGSHGVTPFAVAAAVLGRWLAKRAGVDDVFLRMSYANRERREFETLVCSLVTGLGLPVRQPLGTPFGDLVRRVGADALAAMDHVLPFDRVLRELRAAGRTDLAARPTIAFAYQNLPETDPAFTGLTSRTEDVAAAAARIELSLGMIPRPDPAQGYQLWLEYATDLWDNATAHEMLRDYADSLARCCEPEPVRSAERDHGRLLG